MEIVVVVHPATEASSPHTGGRMWRWAVHVGRDFSDPTSCLNAGLEDEQLLAELRGQQVAVAAARVAERCGQLEVSGLPTTVALVNDPIAEPWPTLTVKEF